MYSAYLIVICDHETNAIINAAIWSSPEWEQSRCLPQRTYVAYMVSGFQSYSEARRHLIAAIRDIRSRYHWLLQYLDCNKETPNA